LKTNSEDEIVKFYAAKTIENITAQSVSTGAKFANQETASALVNVYFTTKNEALKICSTICITHIIVLQSSLIDFVLEKFSA
jgi:hypothetical protein